MPIVMGTIPGVIALVGCSNYPKGTKECYDIAKEFVDRGYIVVTSGCMAMDMSLYTDADGKTIWEQYGGGFDGRNICNTGSCVANANIMGAAIKVATIFARRNHRANFDDIADYILNKVGACGIAWGAYSQKAASIATGCNRLGIPVVVQPHSVMYRRSFVGRADKPEDWMTIDAPMEACSRLSLHPRQCSISLRPKKRQWLRWPSSASGLPITASVEESS
jgi:acetyl-CoA decarbonylase/synthase complex subunit alpha